MAMGAAYGLLFSVSLQKSPKNTCDFSIPWGWYRDTSQFQKIQLVRGTSDSQLNVALSLAKSNPQGRSPGRIWLMLAPKNWGFQGEKVLFGNPNTSRGYLLDSGRVINKNRHCANDTIWGGWRIFKPYRMPLWWQVPSASYLCVVPPNPSILWLFRWKNNSPFRINKNGSPFATPNDPVSQSPQQSQRGSLEWTSNLIPRNCGDFHKHITSE